MTRSRKCGSYPGHSHRPPALVFLATLLALATLAGTTYTLRLNQGVSALRASNQQLVGELSLAETENARLEAGLQEMAQNYLAIFGQVEVRFGDGRDAMQYVTPADALVLEATEAVVDSLDSDDEGRRWQDYEKLYHWVTRNIAYSADSPLPDLPRDLMAGGSVDLVPEYWRLPAETLREGTGDCEDQANLLTSMLKCYARGKCAVYSVILKDERQGHVAAVIVTAGGLSILDPTGTFYTNHVGNLTSKPAWLALREWTEHLAAELHHPFVAECFDESRYRTFASNDEFLSWVTGR